MIEIVEVSEGGIVLSGERAAENVEAFVLALSAIAAQETSAALEIRQANFVGPEYSDPPLKFSFADPGEASVRFRTYLDPLWRSVQWQIHFVSSPREYYFGLLPEGGIGVSFGPCWQADEPFLASLFNSVVSAAAVSGIALKLRDN
jgi:hypothetical protein